MVLALLTLLGGPATAGELVTSWLTVSDGLPSNWTRGLTQDEAGAIWIGGLGVVSRYDGSRIESWTLPHEDSEEVHTIVAMPGGWVAAHLSGGEVRRLEDGTWSAISGPDGEPLSGRVIFRGDDDRLHVVRKGELWAMGLDGRWQRRVEQVEGQAVVTAAAGRLGELLVGTDGGWYRVAEDAQTELLVATDTPQLAAVHGGQTWLQAGQPTRLWRHDDEGSELVFRSPALWAYGLATRDGEAWLLAGSEVVRVDVDGQIERFPQQGSHLIRGTALADRDGSLWFGSFEGLAMVTHPELRRWTVSTGLPTNTARFPTRWKDELWLATWNGIVRFDEAGTPRAADRRVGKGRVCPGDTLWTLVTTLDEGEWLAFSEPDAQAVRHPGPGYAFVLGCDVDAEGAVWMLQDTTLFRAHEASRPPEALAEVPLVAGGSLRLVAIAPDGTLYAGGNHRVCSSPLAAIEAGEADWTCASLPSSRHLADLHITERGTAWALTRSDGILAIEGTEARPVEGVVELPVKDYRNVEPSPRGGQWLMGLGTVVRILDQPDGIEVVEMLPEWLGRTLSSIEGLHEDPDGTLWLASNTGLVRIAPELRDRPVTPPRARLSGLLVDGRLVDHIDGEDRVEVPDGAAVTVHLAALAYRAPGLVRYRHRLGGGTWSAASSSPTLQLAALPAGSRRLAVQASLDGQTWSQPTELQLVVQRPWWRRTEAWALLFGLVATGLLGMQGVRARLRSRAERLRTRVAMDLHDELGAGLASMGLLAGLIAQGGAGDRARELAGRIAEDARSLGANLSGIVWSLRPGHDTLGAVLDYVEHRARALLPHLGEDDLGVLRSPELDALRLDLDVVRAVQLVAMEALTNVARHAEARRLWLEVRRAGRLVELVIEDDGLGLEATGGPSAPDRGLGLQSMEARLAEVGGSLSLGPRPGGGTRLVARFRPQRPWWRRAPPSLGARVPD